MDHIEDEINEVQFNIDNGLYCHIDYLEIEDDNEIRRDQIRDGLDLSQLRDDSLPAVQERYFKFKAWAGDRKDKYVLEIDQAYADLFETFIKEN